MITLNNEYQYIGKSNAINSSGGAEYCILLYAKSVGDATTAKHRVSVKMRIASRTGDSFGGYRSTAFAKADGATVFSWAGANIPTSDWKNTSLIEAGITYKYWADLKEGSVSVNVGVGSPKEITITSSWVLDSYETGAVWIPFWDDYMTASIKVVLPAVYGNKSVITTPTTDVFEYGGKCAISWRDWSAWYFHKLLFRSGDWSFETETVRDTNTSECQIPLELSVNAPTGTGSIEVTLYTYSDKDAVYLIGEDTKTYTLRVPETEETKPTVKLVFAPVSNLSEPFNSLYIQGKSKLKATLDVSTKFGASVVSSYITVNGVVYSDPYESDYLVKTGPFAVMGSVKDSRGFYGYCEDEITVIPYSKPKVQAVYGENKVVATRCDANGNVSSDGTYLQIKAKVGYEKVMADSVQNNFGKLQYRYKGIGSTEYTAWQTILDTKTAETDWIITEPLLDGYLDIKAGYQVQIRATDDIEESEPTTIFISSASVFMDRPAGGRSMGLGGYSTGDGNLDIYWKTNARGGLFLFNEIGEAIHAEKMLPLPRGTVTDDPNELKNGVHFIENPITGSDGIEIMGKGVLIQLAVTADESVLLQFAFPTDSHNPIYRVKENDAWHEWKTI